MGPSTCAVSAGTEPAENITGFIHARDARDSLKEQLEKNYLMHVEKIKTVLSIKDKEIVANTADI